jgi:hypothetical protein
MRILSFLALARLVFGATSDTVAGAGTMSAVLLALFGLSMMAVAVVSPLIADKRRQQAAEELKLITAATRAYIEDLEQSRAFTPIAVPRLHLEQESLPSGMTAPRWRSLAQLGLAAVWGQGCALVGFQSTWAVLRVFRKMNCVRLELANWC